MDPRQDKNSLRGEAAQVVANHLERDIHIKISDFRRWMYWQRKEKLVEVLKKNGFFGSFCYTNVLALEKYLNEFNFARSTGYTLFNTLSEGFGKAKFLSYLSAAKQSPITGKDAKMLQKRFLRSWEESGKSIEAVAELLGFSGMDHTGLTYESMDIFIEYVALRTHKKPDEALSEALKHLRHKLGDFNVARGVMNAKDAAGQFAMNHGLERHEVADVVLEKEHDGFAKTIKTELFDQWMTAEVNPDKLYKYLYSSNQNSELSLVDQQILQDFTAFYKTRMKNSLDNSVSPRSTRKTLLLFYKEHKHNQDHLLELPGTTETLLLPPDNRDRHNTDLSLDLSLKPPGTTGTLRLPPDAGDKHNPDLSLKPAGTTETLRLPPDNGDKHNADLSLKPPGTTGTLRLPPDAGDTHNLDLSLGLSLKRSGT